MDGDRFDDWTRGLTAVRSRRTLTRILGGGALLASLVAVGLGEAAAKGKGKGKKKPRKKPVCLCSAAGCTSQKVKKPSKLIQQDPRCNYAGRCTTNPCAAGALPPGSPPPGCSPQPDATTCAGLCGERLNNCNQPVACPCPSGLTCLPNGTCARLCTAEAECAGCTPGDSCSLPSTEGQRLCIVGDIFCQNRPSCDPANPTTSGCPVGFACHDPCGGFGPRCLAVAVCPAT
jgi:hypothetical protein